MKYLPLKPAPTPARSPMLNKADLLIYCLYCLLGPPRRVSRCKCGPARIGLYSRGEDSPVLGYFWKKLAEVLDALLEPFFLWVRTWIKGLSWQGRTVLLVLAGLMALAFLYWKSLPLVYQTAVAFAKVATNAPTQIPLDSSIKYKKHPGGSLRGCKPS